MPNYKIEITGTNIIDLFQNTGRFVIPKYQRPYSWREKEWKDLLRDLLEHWRSQSQYSSDYAMGEIRLERAEESADPFQVADGQQRLLTFSFLIAALMYVIKNVHGRTDINDRSYLFDSVASPEGNQDLQRISDQFEGISQVIRQIYTIPEPSSLGGSFHEKCYIWFVKEINEEFASDIEDLLKFRFHIYSKLIFTKSISGPGTGQQSFARANSRGKKLDEADLIKFKLLEIANHGHDAAMVWEHWQSFVELCRDARIKESKALILWAATDLSDDSAPVRKSEARDLIEVAARQYKNSEGVGVLTSKLVTMMTAYKHVLAGNGTMGEASAQYANLSKSQTLKKLKQLTSLALCCRHMSEDDRRRVALEIENTVVVAAYARAFPPDVEKLVNKVRMVWRQSIDPSTHDFERGFELLKEFRDSLAQKFARTIFYETEMNLPPRGAFTAVAYVEAHIRAMVNSTTRGELDWSATLEHILPQSLNPELISDFGTGEEATIDRYRIGNMTLLEGPQNSVNSNKLFADKHDMFDACPFRITQLIVKSLAGHGAVLTQISSVLAPAPVWNREQLILRTRGIHKLLCETLNIQCVDPGEHELEGNAATARDQSDAKIPQADSPDEMIRFVDCLAGGNETLNEVSMSLECEPRHAGYYLNALTVVALAEVDEGLWQLTDEGLELSASENKVAAMASAIKSTPLMELWSALQSDAEKDAFLANHDISGGTITRRKKTMDNWITWCNSVSEN